MSLIKVEFDPSLNLSLDEKLMAIQRMASFGKWIEDGDLFACFPDKLKSVNEKLIREGFRIIWWKPSERK